MLEGLFGSNQSLKEEIVKKVIEWLKVEMTRMNAGYAKSIESVRDELQTVMQNAIVSSIKNLEQQFKEQKIDPVLERQTMALESIAKAMVIATSPTIGWVPE